MKTLPHWALPLWRDASVHYIVVDRRADATSETDGFYWGTTAAGGYPERVLHGPLASRFDNAGLSGSADSRKHLVYTLGARA